MTRKLEELLEIDIEDVLADISDIEEQDENASCVINSITVSEKVDNALTFAGDLSSHDREMDDIAKEAMATYRELKTIGENISDAHAGKIYEVAGVMLKTAMDAKESKLQRKLRTIDLQLKKLRIDKMDISKPSDEDTVQRGIEFDRNELLARITEANRDKEKEKESNKEDKHD